MREMSTPVAFQRPSRPSIESNGIGGRCRRSNAQLKYWKGEREKRLPVPFVSHFCLY
jgi:hypothetical protein